MSKPATCDFDSSHLINGISSDALISCDFLFLYRRLEILARWDFTVPVYWPCRQIKVLILARLGIWSWHIHYFKTQIYNVHHSTSHGDVNWTDLDAIKVVVAECCRMLCHLIVFQQHLWDDKPRGSEDWTCPQCGFYNFASRQVGTKHQ